MLKSIVMDKIKLGKLGENYAEQFLLSQNYQIFTRNFYSRFGEIDIITFDYSNRQIAFIEVKTRTSTDFGLPQDALTARKKSRLLKTALCFLNQKYPNRAISWRIDLIAVQLDEQNHLQELTHFKNILDG